MNHSRRYQSIKKEIPQNKIFSLTEALKFLANHNKEKIKTLKASFSLNLVNQKANLKIKTILPNPLKAKSKIAIVKDELPSNISNELANNTQAELLTSEEIRQCTIGKNGKVKKKSQWGFTRVLVHPNGETSLKPLEKLLVPKGIYPNKRNGYLTENILDEVEKFQNGEQEIKTDKSGNIQFLIGNNDFTQQQLEENCKDFHNKLVSLLPPKAEIKSITLSTAMGPGIRIRL